MTLSPQAITEAEQAPTGAHYELSWDGERRLVGPRSTGLPSSVARAFRRVRATSWLVDGVLGELDENGLPARGGSGPAIYFVFDLLSLDGQDLRDRPIEARRAALERILPKSRALVLSVASPDGDALKKIAADRGMTHVIAKKAGSRYGEKGAWLAVPVGGGRPLVGGISISNPSRILTPTTLTKLELARYAEAIAPWMLPHVRNRPLTLLRWAEGRETEKGGVFLRHAKAWGPPALTRVAIREQRKTGEYLVATDAASIVSLAQMDILEIHTWNSTTLAVEHPNRIVVDLDPAPGLPWRAVTDAARHVRQALAAVGLESWVKTTGGKGLHVVVPLAPLADWDVTYAFARDFAKILAQAEPKRFVVTVPKQHREGRILLDVLRNNRGNTSVAAFSIRARERAPVSVPVDWDELTREFPKHPFTIGETITRVASLRDDPWRGYFRCRQRLKRSTSR